MNPFTRDQVNTIIRLCIAIATITAVTASFMIRTPANAAAVQQCQATMYGYADERADDKAAHAYAACVFLLEAVTK